MSIAKPSPECEALPMPDPIIAIDTHPEPTSRMLGKWMSTAMVVGSMVGSGIYLLPTTLAPFGPNMVVAFVPGKRAVTYDKRHLLLPDEAKYQPGTRSGYIGNGIAVAICKDLDFPRTIRGDAEAGIRLMIVPANDFYLDDWLHARQAMMRGVENGFAVLRSAVHGLATVTDDRGRILARARVDRPGFVVAEADVPPGAGPTLYTRLGDWFAWLCVALTIGVGVLSLRAGTPLPSGPSATPVGRYA